MAVLNPAVVSADGKFIQPLAPYDKLGVDNLDVMSLIPNPPAGSGLKVDGNGKLVIDPNDAADVLADALAELGAGLPKRMTKAEWDGMDSAAQAGTVNTVVLEENQIVAWVMNGQYNELGRAVVS